MKSIRDYAEECGVEVIGNLRRIIPSKHIKNIQIYRDEAGTEFWVNTLVKTIQIFEGGSVY